MTPAIPGSDLVPDEEFRAKVLGVAFAVKPESVPPEPKPAAPKLTDHEPLADIQARLRAETAQRARKAGRQM